MAKMIVTEEVCWMQRCYLQAYSRMPTGLLMQQCKLLQSQILNTRQAGHLLLLMLMQATGITCGSNLLAICWTSVHLRKQIVTVD